MCVTIFSTTATQVYALGDAKAFFEVTNSGFSDDEITYTIKLAAEQTKVTGAIIKVAFDSTALEVVECHAAGAYNADGDFVENVAGVYETGIQHDDVGVYALAYMNVNGFTVGNEDKDFFVIKFRAISEERRPTGVDFFCVEYVTDDGDDDNDIRKATDGLQQICDTHTFNTLSMPKVTEVNSLNDGLRVVWSEAIGATSYKLYRRTATETTWTELDAELGAVTEYVDNSVTKGVEYFYTVSAANEYGTTEYDATGISGMNFGTIESISATIEGSSAIISWSALNGATSYEVYRKIASSNNWQNLITVSSISYKDTTIASGVLYEYKVKALNGKYSADMSCDPVSVMYIATPETTVSNASAGIEIYFEDVNGAEKYVIEKKIPGGAYNVIAEITAGEDNMYTDEDVVVGGKYIYRIQAVAGEVESAKKEFPEITRLGTPVLSEVKNVKNGVSVAWEAVADASGYVIWRKTADTNWVNYAESNTTNFVDTDVVSGTEYFYMVSAENETGCGDYSNSLSVNYVATPVISSVANSAGGIRIVWAQVGGATGYNVYRVVKGNSDWTKIATVAECSYVDSAAVVGVDYRYTVSAVIGDVESAYDLTGVDGMNFGTVTTISAKAIENGAQISWNALERATSYEVFRKTASDSSWESLGKVNVNSYTDTSINSGVVYYYMVKAYSGNNVAEMTAEPVSVKFLAVPVSNVANASNGIKITIKPVGGAEAYVIEKKVDGVYKTLVTLDADETTYIDTDVVGEQTYSYRVYAKATDIKSGYYETAQITRLGAPKIVTIKNTIPGVSLTWTAVDDAVEYEVYRKIDNQTEWEYIITVSSTSYVDGDVYSGEKCTYTINALTADGGYSGYDNTGKTITFVETPDLKKAANTSSGVSVTWEAVDGAAYYRVYRRVQGGSWSYLGYTKGTSFVDKGDKYKLVSGTRYDYTIIAVIDGIYSDFDKTGVSLVYLTTPKLTKVNNVQNGVNVTWGAVKGATGYRVYRKAGSATSWSYIGYTTKTNYIDSKVTNGIYYRYTIIAVNGTYSDFDRTGKNVKYVAAPKVTGVSNVAGGIYVKWNAVKGATQYRVYRRRGGSMTWGLVGTTKNTYFTDKGIVNQSGTYYIYTVIAVNGYYSGFESGLTIKRLINPVLKSATSYKSGIYVKWNPVKGATGYYVYRKTAGSGWAKVGFMTGVNNTTFVDKTAQKGVTYTYTIRACSGATLSAYNTYGISCKDRY